jgi:hypothetical protein
VGDERVAVHLLHDLRVAREVLVLEPDQVRVRRDVAQPLEMLERVEAGDDAPGAVPEEKDG